MYNDMNQSKMLIAILKQGNNDALNQINQDSSLEGQQIELEEGQGEQLLSQIL